MSLFNSIKFKVWVCVGVIALGFLVATLITFRANNSLVTNLSSLGEVNFPLSLKGTEVENLFSKQINLYEDAFLLGDEESLEKANTLGDAIAALLAGMIDLSNRGSQRQWRPLHDDLVGFAEGYATYRDQAQRYYAMLVEGQAITSVQRDIQRLGQLQQQLTAAIHGLNANYVASVKGQIIEGMELSNNTSSLILVLFLVVLILSAFIVNLAASRLLIRPIRAVQHLAGRLADGDIDATRDVAVPAGGEVGDLVRAMVGMADNLREMVLKVNASSEAMAEISRNLTETARKVDTSAKDQVDAVSKTSLAIEGINGSVADVARSMDSISSTSGDVTTSALEQVATTEEIAQNAEHLSASSADVNASIVQIASNIKQISENVSGLKEEADITASSVVEMETSIRQVEQGANETATITASVRQDAEAGWKAVKDAIDGISRIKESSSRTSEAIDAFAQKAQHIGEILSMIDELTNQTNLLALNAAIIAAQAGEQGRGFAVVADQIKELADRTRASTNEIALIIEGVQKDSQQAVAAIDEAQLKIAEGESLSLLSGEALGKIVSGSKMVADEMDKISNATREQAKGGRMIRVSMDRVADRINQIVAAIREQETGSNMIISVSEGMHNLTDRISASTREQSDASRNVAAGMEEVNDMIQKVNLACDRQRRESQQILEAIEGIKNLTQINLESTSVVSEASERLNQHTDHLQEGIGKFKIRSSTLPEKIDKYSVEA